MMFTLSQIIEVSNSCGYPTDRTTLTLRLEREGCSFTVGQAGRGQSGKLYYGEKLPEALRKGLRIETIVRVSKEAAVDFTVYLEAPQKSKEKANKALRRMELMSAEITSGATVAEAADRVSGKPEGGVSSRTLRRAWDTVKDLPWDQWRAALVPGWKPRKAKPIHEEAWDLWFTLYGRQSEPSAQQTYEEVAKAAKKNAWGDLPSLKTFQRRWDALPAAVKTAARKGEKAADRRHTPPGDLDRSGTPVYEHFTVDSRRFDTHSVNPIGLDIEVVDGDRRFRPMVAAAIEGVTSYCLHVEVMGDTEHTVLYRRLLTTTLDIHGLPDWVLFDSTMAAANKDITGGAEVRYRWNRAHDEAAGMLKRCNIEPRFSKPGQPWGKIVERFWLDVKDRVEKDPELEGSYLGKDTVSKPGNYGAKAVPFDVFKRVLARAVKEYNERRERRGKAGSCYKDAFEEGMKGRLVRRFTAEQRRAFLGEAYVVTPTPSGVVTIGEGKARNQYFHAKLQDFGRPVDGKGKKGRKIILLVDPEDYFAPAMAYDMNNTLLIGEVPHWGKREYGNKAHVAELSRAQNDVRKARKAEIKAQRRLDDVEVRALRQVDDTPQEHPSAPVTRMVPGKTPKVANDGAARRTAPAQSRPMDLGPAIAGLMQFKT